MYTEIFLRLEPLGVELVAAAARQAGHQVRILDLQVFSHADYFRALDGLALPTWSAFGVNYLANIPEVVDLAKETRRQAARTCCSSWADTAPRSRRRRSSRTPKGAIDCVIRGEGEEIAPRVLEAGARSGRPAPRSRAC